MPLINRSMPLIDRGLPKTCRKNEINKEARVRHEMLEGVRGEHPYVNPGGGVGRRRQKLKKTSNHPPEIETPISCSLSRLLRPAPPPPPTLRLDKLPLRPLGLLRPRGLPPRLGLALVPRPTWEQLATLGPFDNLPRPAI